MVAAANPGNDPVLEKEVRTLRKLMYAQGILSVNAVPDLIFERALREGWRSRVSVPLRTALAVSPLSASAWALLIKDDILDARMDELPRDIDERAKVFHFGASAGRVQQARSFLRVVAEIRFPEIVEALCAGVRQLPVLLGPLGGSVSRGFASRQAGQA